MELDDQRLATEVSRLVLLELEAAAERQEFGVIVRDVRPYDAGALAVALRASPAVKKGRLRAALVGANIAIEAPDSTISTLTAREEVAIQWRNEWYKTIAVITDRPLAKAASLREFRHIAERDLINRLCKEQESRADVHWLRALWNALGKGHSLRLSLRAVVRFALVLNDLPQESRSTDAARHLSALGLFPDLQLPDQHTDQQIVQRLKQNRGQIDLVRQAEDDDWARIQQFCRSLTRKEKSAAQSLMKRLRELSGRAPDSIWTELSLQDLDEVRRLWLARPDRQKATKNGKTKHVAVEMIVGELALNREMNRLSDVTTELSQIVQHAMDDEDTGREQRVEHASNQNVTAVLDVDGQLLALVRERSSVHNWGGIISISSERPDALVEQTAFSKWEPFRLQDAIAQAQAFVDVEAAPSHLPKVLVELGKLRACLLPAIAELTVSPISMLAGRPNLLVDCNAYIQVYDQVLKTLAQAYPGMQSASPDRAEELLSLILALELYVYRRESVVEVVLSPLHPLHLWRSATVVSDVLDLKQQLSEAEAYAVQKALAEDIQLLPTLLIPATIAGTDKPQLFGQAGLLGRLQIFRSAPRGILEPDGIKTVGDLAVHFATLRPFARAGLQVMLVDVPKPVRFIEELLKRLDIEREDQSIAGLHIRVRYTQEDTAGWAAEVMELNDTAAEQLAIGEQRGVASLSVHPQRVSWENLLGEMEATPAHLAVIMDPFEVKAQTVHRLSQQPLGPWMPTLSYSFDRLDKEIQPIPVADDQVFGTYRNAAALLETSLHKKNPANLPQVKKVRGSLERISKLASWTVLADPHRVPLPRLGEAELIDRRMDRGRQLTCFGRDLSAFARRLDSQLTRTHFKADATTLGRLVRDLAALEPNGILRLGDSNSEKQVKGSLGKVIASRWYRAREPQGLTISLDTAAASQWLVAGQQSGQKADLLGLTEEDGTVVVDVIEVKTHDDATPYAVTDGVIRGGAVDQVLATMQAVAEVFASGTRSPLATPRREVLREHLYAALSRDQDPKYVEHWFNLLEDIFAGATTVRLRGRVMHVQMASIAPIPSMTYETRLGIPVQVQTLSAADVGFTLATLRGAPVLVSAPSSGRAGNLAGLDPTSVLARLVARVDPLPSVDPLAPNEPAMAMAESEVAQPSSPPDLATNSPVGVVLDVHLGHEHASSNEVHWTPGKLMNGFLLVLGSSGSGKTESLKRVGIEICLAGIPVLVFDFHGDVTFAGLKSYLLSSGTASTARLNPMELDSDSAAVSGLYDQRQTLLGLITRAVPTLGHKQKRILKEAIEQAYADKGITDDPKSWKRLAPTFEDVVAILQEWTASDEHKTNRAAIEGCLSAVDVLFGHPVFKRGNVLALDALMSQATRLDLSKLPDEVRFMATETLLRKIFRSLRLRGPIPVQPTSDLERFRLFVVIDEAKILSLGSGQRDMADNILNELITEARKFGLGMILASQMSAHFSPDVRSNAASWLVLKPNYKKEADQNASNVSVSPEDLMQLAGRGDGYFRDRPSSRARRIQVTPTRGE